MVRPSPPFSPLPLPSSASYHSALLRLPLALLPSPTLDRILSSALASAPSLPHLKQAHALLLRLHLHTLPFFVSKLICRLTALGHPLNHPYSLRLFSCAPPLPSTFSALLKSAATIPSLTAGAQIHARAVTYGGFSACVFVQNALIAMYVACSDLRSARKMFDEMLVRDVISWTSLLVAYTRIGDMVSAVELFRMSPVKDMVAWTAMITGYAQNAMPKEALETFDQMRGLGIEIDEVPLIGAISACAQLGAAGHACRLQKIADRYGFAGNVVLGSSLIDMHAKCGLIDEAQKVFAAMEVRNVYTYSSMIVGLASHGRAHEALSLFLDMVARTNVRPNHVTFIGLLTACSHAKMLEEGRFYFTQMRDEYGIAHTADHYACMVDLLGRSGLVEEALELVGSMTVKPHAGVWGALLSACRIHKKPYIAKIAAHYLFKLEPDGIGNYILLSNIYSSVGMWDEVSLVRKSIRGRGLRKNPAVSWVEDQEGLIHQFFASDNIHPRSGEIKQAVEELIGKLKSIGYVPILASVVYNVVDNEKERLLKGHSEKFALAFALLTAVSVSTIRIVKNLRICEDCHLVMCFTSKAENVEIVVRDNMRFHHFKNGRCSCGEFW